MKIGIITITQGTNYGNRLQIYAVQQVLKKLGHEGRLILNNTGVNSAGHKVKRLVKILLGLRDAREEYFRERSYRQFDRKYLRVEEEALDEFYAESRLGQRYDAFICGSDQVWNPFTPYMNGIFFADIPNVKKRISYAASFGVEELPERTVQQYSKWLRGFDAISVREESGKRIVESLTEKQATVLVDPTMMLDGDEWAKIEEKPEGFSDRKYIFQYFLGPMDSKVQAFLTKISGENDLEIVNVLPDKKDKNYRLNPSHFIYLLHHAELVVTDSFHAVVFSMLFQKPFRVFDRVHKGINMSTRLDTLLPYFGLTRYRNNFDPYETEQLNYDLEEKLEIRRKESTEFLKRALGD